MIRHFSFLLFWGFLSSIIFVNLFQFAGGEVPFEVPYFEQDFDDSIFGFTSIFMFIKTIGGDEGIKSGIEALGTGFGIIKQFSIDNVVSLFDSARSMGSTNPGLVVVVILTSLLRIIIDALIMPFTLMIGIVVMIYGIIIFLWQMITIICRFLLGYYNVVYVPSGLLETTQMVFLQTISI